MYYAYQGAFRRDVEYSRDDDLEKIDILDLGHSVEEIEKFRTTNKYIELVFLVHIAL